MTTLISCFDFTYFGEHCNDYVKFSDILATISDKFCFQKELCPDTKREHYQGRMHMKVRIRLTTLSNKLKKMGIPMHLSITSNCNKTNDFYVMKDETRIDGPWLFGKEDDNDTFLTDWEEDALKMKPYPWQESILEMMKVTRDRRTVHVIIDIEGGKGKSSLIEMMLAKKIGYRIPFMKSYKELTTYVCSLLVERKERSPKNFCFDIPRAILTDCIFSSIETIKGGLLFDARYKATEWRYNVPNIFVFTNDIPDIKLLSKDRWKLWTINDKMELIPWNEAEERKIFPKAPNDIYESLE